MIQREYKRLLKMIEEGLDPKGVPLEEILSEAVVFFEALRKEFPAASQDDREAMIHMMTDLHAKLQEVSKKAAEEAGMSEEQLSSFGEDPSNFTPEQWQEIQKTKQRLYDSARKFSSDMSQEGRNQVAGDEELKKKPSKPPIKSTARRTKRKDWTKS